MSQQLATQNKEALADTQGQSVCGLVQSVLIDGQVVILTPWMPLNMVSPEGEFINHAEGTSADLMIHTTIGVSGGIGNNANGESTVQSINGGLIGLVRSLHPGETTDKESYKAITALQEVIGETVLRDWFVNHGYTMKAPAYFGPSVRAAQDVSGIEYLRANFSEEEFESTTRMSAAGINSIDADEDIGDDVKAVCKDLNAVKVDLSKKVAEELGFGAKATKKSVLDIVQMVASRFTWVPYGTTSGDGFESSPSARLKVIRK